MATTLTGHINPFLSWRVYYDSSLIETDVTKDRIGISFGLLSANNAMINTNDVAEGGALNIKRKTSIQYPTPFKDLFLDLQTEKYLYAKITLATNSVELEYSSSPPSGSNAIDIVTNEFRRIPLAFITASKYIVDLRPLGGAGGSSSVEPFTIFVEVSEEEGVDNIITLWPGTINQLLPTNILSEFSETPQSTRYVKLRVLTNGKAVTGATIVVEASGTGAIDTLQGTAPTTFDVLIGVVVNGTPFQVTSGNIVATLTEALREAKAVPSPGLSPYNFYYTWEVE